MLDYSLITLSNEIIGYTPRHMCVNVEIQDHHESSNLWDWIADSGVTGVRTFHPEQTLRKTDVKPGRFGDITNKADFETWRHNLLKAPTSNLIDWDNYQFNEHVPWMGTPDGFIDKINALNLYPLYSLGYGTAHFERPLIKDIETQRIPGEQGIDWEAAASAYAYYFAVIHHYATEFNAVYFMMINEPENRSGWFYLPEDLKDQSWYQLFHEADEETITRYAGILAAQVALLSQLARMAFEDVKALIGDSNQTRAMKLTGPTTVMFKPIWEQAAPYLDALDYHHYHDQIQTFPSLHQTASQLAMKHQKMTAITEFNRYSGGTQFDRILFTQEGMLETARLLMTVTGMSTPSDPELHIAALYLLHFPSTHRNYKHLLYGDMNLIDWSMRDTALWNRGKEEDTAFGDEAWYPSFDELQIRHITPAYAVFKMFNRAIRQDFNPYRVNQTTLENAGPRKVLRSGMVNPTSSGPQDTYDQLQVQVIEQPERLFIHLLNASDQAAGGVRLDFSELEKKYTRATVRITSATQYDILIDEHEIGDVPIPINVPANAFVQVIGYTSEMDYALATHLHIKDQSITPGDLQTGLDVHQTTRLRVMGMLNQTTVDLTDMNVIFASSQPEIVRVTSTGLVQRLRDSNLRVTLSARTLDNSWQWETSL